MYAMAEVLNPVDPVNVLEQFAESHWEEAVPRLSEEDRHAVEAYFDGKMRLVADVLPIGHLAEANMGAVLSANGHAGAELRNFRDAVVGPYFLKGQYYPQGVAVWGLINRKGQSRHSTKS